MVLFENTVEVAHIVVTYRLANFLDGKIRGEYEFFGLFHPLLEQIVGKILASMGLEGTAQVFLRHQELPGHSLQGKVLAKCRSR